MATVFIEKAPRTSWAVDGRAPRAVRRAAAADETAARASPPSIKTLRRGKMASADDDRNIDGCNRRPCPQQAAPNLATVTSGPASRPTHLFAEIISVSIIIGVWITKNNNSAATRRSEDYRQRMSSRKFGCRRAFAHMQIAVAYVSMPVTQAAPVPAAAAAQSRARCAIRHYWR